MLIQFNNISHDLLRRLIVTSLDISIKRLTKTLKSTIVKSYKNRQHKNNVRLKKRQP